jgi:hypothetical protein
MDKDKQAKLASKGWKIGTVNEFLDLTPAEATYIELRLALIEDLLDYQEAIEALDEPGENISLEELKKELG